MNNEYFYKCCRALAMISVFAGCATTSTGRKSLNLMPESQMNAMGVSAFDELKKDTPIEKDPKINAYVQCVATAVATEAQSQTKVPSWEIVVFQDKQVNAFALPGGKIGVYTGILPVANTPNELAAVLGHEVGHVIAQHGNERVSEGLLAQGGLTAVEAFLGNGSYKPIVMGALGAGAQYGILLPHGRGQESEADIIGLDLMARAGFNPEEAVLLWQNMQKAGGGGPPEFLSTHPSNDTRIKGLQAKMPEALETYKKAKAAGKNPNCALP